MKETIIRLLKSTNRIGMENLIKYLEDSDFFYAPASSKFHSNFEGGLAKHSYYVYKSLDKMNKDFNLGLKDETIIITSLLHDLCKINNYVKEKKWRKNGKEWEDYLTYVSKDDFPIGHGEKSVIIALRYIKMTDEEINMVRWHMGGYEPKDNIKYLNKAYSKYKGCTALHLSDMQATHFLEKTIKY